MGIAYKRKKISRFISLRRIGTAACLLAILFFSGCGKDISWQNADSLPPQKTAGFAAANNDGRIVLTWTAPADPDFRGVLIRRGTQGFPQDPAAPGVASDIIVYSGAATTFTDTGLTSGAAYFYSAFAFDENLNYSDGVFASATCSFLPFTIIALPDSQYLSLSYPDLFKTQTQWVADNKTAKNILFVLHEGDVTHTNSVEEWTNASEAMANLEGVVPYVIAPGNHDDGSGRNTAKFNAAFPVSRFSSLPSFGGVFEPDKIDNTYHFFEAGGIGWMIVALEFDPRDEALAWADQIVAAHPDRRVIVLTHAYLSGYNHRDSIGENIWTKFVKKHKNISFVFNGHITDTQASRQVSVGDNGNNVYQMMANYQTLPFGGTGYLRIVEIDPNQSKVSVKTYTPWTDVFKTDADNQFEFENVDLGPP
ncbi:MAG: metallophosphoesterase [bacterium]